MDADVEQMQAGSNYKFSGTRIDKLGASEYTLVDIVCDASTSVEPFAPALETMLKTVWKACYSSKRKDNLMIRLTQFSHRVTELFGYKLLASDPKNSNDPGLKESDLNGILNIGGNTALFEAVDAAVSCMAAYGKSLLAQEFQANGIIFVITDGMNNEGHLTPEDIAKSVAKAKMTEVLESLTIVLIGVTSGSVDMNTYLKDFADRAKIDRYIDIGSATAGKLAKLGDFVSQSISSTSQALGSGGPSQPIAAKF